MILKYLKKFAEIFEGGKKIKYTVITVSAHFNNLQRIATIEASDKAGLKVIKKLMNQLQLQLPIFNKLE